MAAALSLVLVVLCSHAHAAFGASAPLVFAKAYSDHMVLQSAPKISQVWGWWPQPQPQLDGAAALGPTPPPCANITLQSMVDSFVFSQLAPVAANGMWKVRLPPMNASGSAFQLTAAACGDPANVATLKDVVFGEVWPVQPAIPRPGLC